MIISHKYKLIYIKNKMVAGTSTEVLLENALFSNINQFKIYTKVINNLEGVTNNRAQGGQSHISLQQIYKKYSNHYKNVPEKNNTPKDPNHPPLQSYFSVCNTRNPFDQAVSAYHHPKHVEKRGFKKWLLAKERSGRLDYMFNRNNYVIVNGKLAVDFVIRYEHLREDLLKLFNKLSLDVALLDKLPRLNPGKRPQGAPRTHYSEYYDDESIEAVNNCFKDVINYFNYKVEYENQDYRRKK